MDGFLGGKIPVNEAHRLINEVVSELLSLDTALLSAVPPSEANRKTEETNDHKVPRLCSFSRCIQLVLDG